MEAVSVAKLGFQSVSAAKIGLQSVSGTAACRNGVRRRISRVSAGVKCDDSTLYDFLGVPRDASAKNIKDAYRRSVKIWHPDLAARSQLHNATSEFIKIRDAYLVLSDPETRARYDRSLGMQNCRVRNRCTQRSSPGAVEDYKNGECILRFWNWETDQCW